MDQIIIKQAYFDNIKNAVDSINQFFESGFQVKNFPADTGDLDWAINNVTETLRDLDPAYVSDTSKLDTTVNNIKSTVEEKGDMPVDQIMMDRPLKNKLESVVSYSTLQLIANNFDSFSKYINGIYTFELFLKPSLYKTEIETFGANVELPYELEDLDIQSQLFSVDLYVTDLFNNPDITMPDSMNAETEIQRILEFRDAQNTEVVVNDAETNQVQEAAVDTKRFVIISDNIKYTGSKFTVSSQYEKWISNLLANIRKCGNINDLRNVITNLKIDPKFVNAPLPFILVQALQPRLNDSQFAVYKEEMEKAFNPIKNKREVIRYAKYSIYDTFKTDREGTIKFLEDYLKLNLVNEKTAMISNKVIFTLFAEFDAPVYFGSLYDQKMGKNRLSDNDAQSFIKTSLARIKTNSEKVNPYGSKKGIISDDMKTADIQESVIPRLKEIGNIGLSEILYCEAYKQILRDEAAIMNDVAYNNGISTAELESTIGEDLVTEAAGFGAALMNIKNQLMNMLRNEFTFIGGSMNPKFVMTSTDKPDVSFDVSMNGQNVEVTPKYKEMADFAHKRRGIAIMNAANTIASFVRDLVAQYRPVTESYVFESNLYKNRPAARGEVPDYMKSRMDLSDGDEKPNENEKPVPDPLAEPANPVDDLADSVDDKMDMDGNIDELIGDKFKKPKGDDKIVYNITYNNSFNKSNDLSTNVNSKNTSNDLSTGKTNNRNSNNTSNDLSSDKTTTNHTNSHNTSSHDSHNSSHDSHNVTNTHDSHNTTTNNYDTSSSRQGKNNNNNSSESLDSKEFKEYCTSLNDRTLSNGLSIGDLFTFLESEEPLSNEFDTKTARKAPKSDSLTRAMDRDRKSLHKQQNAKKNVQKFGNTVRATFKPIVRTKQWMTSLVNSLVERDENKVKEEIIENPSYRNSLYKGLRIAVKLGLVGIAFTISGYLGAATVGLIGARDLDKRRLAQEVQDEFITELKVMDEKIDHARAANNQQELYKLMRLKGKMEGIAADAAKGRWKRVKPNEIRFG